MTVHRTNSAAHRILNSLSGNIALVIHVIVYFTPLKVFNLITSALTASNFNTLVNCIRLLTILLNYVLFITLIVGPVVIF